jgi:hypothetical protein
MDQELRGISYYLHKNNKHLNLQQFLYAVSNEFQAWNKTATQNERVTLFLSLKLYWFVLSDNSGFPLDSLMEFTFTSTFQTPCLNIKDAFRPVGYKEVL